MKVAYIAGPYRADTIYGINENIRKAEKVALKYWKKGYAVICPHKNTALFDGECDDKIWMEGGLELLKRCDVLVMMKGWAKSKGTVRERKEALQLDINIIYDYDN